MVQILLFNGKAAMASTGLPQAAQTIFCSFLYRSNRRQLGRNRNQIERMSYLLY